MPKEQTSVLNNTWIMKTLDTIFSFLYHQLHITNGKNSLLIWHKSHWRMSMTPGLMHGVRKVFPHQDCTTTFSPRRFVPKWLGTFGIVQWSSNSRYSSDLWFMIGWILEICSIENHFTWHPTIVCCAHRELKKRHCIYSGIAHFHYNARTLLHHREWEAYQV